MKKLWRQEWKYYLTMFGITSTLIVLGIIREFNYLCQDYDDMRIGFSMPQRVEMVSSYIVQDARTFMSIAATLTLWMVLLHKGIHMWIKKEESTRNFLICLPVQRGEQFRFHLLMNVCYIVISILFSAVVQIIAWKQFFAEFHFDIPWLEKGIFGIAVVLIGYLLMLLGIVYLLENQFVNGKLKLFVTATGMCMLGYDLNLLFGMFKTSRLMQKIYGIFRTQSVGPMYCSLSGGFPYQGEWIHDGVSAPIIYDGKTIYSEFGYETCAQTYDLATDASYLFYVFFYLFIAALLFAFSNFLVKRQEASKNVFYFKGGSYMVSTFVTFTFFRMTFDAKMRLWNQILSFVASILLFVLLNYLLRGKGKKLEKEYVA